MAWFKVDDSFPQHPKVLAIPRRHRAAAVGLWTLGGTWCAAQLTDGYLGAHMVEELASTQRHADLLVEVGLWEVADGGYQIHDYLDYNPSADEVRADQARKHEAKAKAGRAGGIASGIARRKHEGSRVEAESKQNGSETKPRPDPTPSASNEAEKNSPSPDGEAAFDRFYAAYPRKVGRKDAEKAFTKAAIEVDPEELVAAAERYAADPNQPTDRSKIPHPATWLNQGRWGDEPLPARFDQPTTIAPGARLTTSELENLLGPDVWSAPMWPSHMDADEGWQWQHARILEHQQERQRLARGRMGRTA